MAFMSIAAGRGFPEGNEEWHVGFGFSPFNSPIHGSGMATYHVNLLHIVGSFV